MLTEIIGWLSAGILALTLSRQVWSQWRSGKTEGVSHWLFIGQCAASVGFVVYSYLVENWVFVAVNAFILLIAVVGQLVYLRNKRNAAGKTAASAARP